MGVNKFLLCENERDVFSLLYVRKNSYRSSLGDFWYELARIVVAKQYRFDSLIFALKNSKQEGRHTLMASDMNNVLSLKREQLKVKLWYSHYCKPHYSIKIEVFT